MRREVARLSVQLDASPLTEETAARVDAEGRSFVAQAPHRADVPSGGGWARVLRLDELPTQDVAAVEYANALAAVELERELASQVFAHPLYVLTRLHAQFLDGLADPDRFGQLRTIEQDVHDGAQGKVVYRTPAPGDLPPLVDSLMSWLGRGSASKPALVVAGVVHERLLEWQPFDAANGRLARVAARVILRARGLDPRGAAVPERVFAADPLAYVGEVAASIRRRGDLTHWLERYGEALVAELEDAAVDDDAPRPQPPARAIALVGELAGGGAFTLADYMRRGGIDREAATGELLALERARVVRPEPGSQGLRFQVR